MVHSYRDLLVWQKAKALSINVYRATEVFPRSDAVSIVSNIAEGQGRLTSGEFLHFLGLARGSLMELEAQLAIAVELRYLELASHGRLSSKLYRVLGLLNRLIESIRRKRAG